MKDKPVVVVKELMFMGRSSMACTVVEHPVLGPDVAVNTSQIVCVDVNRKLIETINTIYDLSNVDTKLFEATTTTRQLCLM